MILRVRDWWTRRIQRAELENFGGARAGRKEEEQDGVGKIY